MHKGIRKQVVELTSLKIDLKIRDPKKEKKLVPEFDLLKSDEIKMRMEKVFKPYIQFLWLENSELCWMEAEKSISKGLLFHTIRIQKFKFNSPV